MPFPKNIEKTHLLKAIDRIDKEGIPDHGASTHYDVVFRDKAYPPKLIVSYANYFANGQVLDRNSFAGGEGTPCFELLRKNGFVIQEKNDSFLRTLLMFLTQASAPIVDLKTHFYDKSYDGLKLEVSFGAGNVARVPWIAFLREDQEVTKGIYPVFLYYRRQQLLILAYGISETNDPVDRWMSSAETIQNFFYKTYGEKPPRYGSSLIFSHYNIDKNKKNFGLDLNQVRKNFEQLINEYKGLTSTNKVKNKIVMEALPFDYKELIASLSAAHLSFSKEQILRFICSLCTKPFVILTGLSGSGKTRLALAFCKWISNSERQVCVIPVGADWTNRDPLLGYPNALEKNSYILPDNNALNIILNANDDPGNPYFLILDEMNLSHVERYFADFLSAMESGEYIHLHSLEKGIGAESAVVPAKIKLPKNLFVIGTVNIDETTYMFSPKVLDRANVIEFKVSLDEMREYLENNGGRLEIEQLKSKGALMAQSFVRFATEKIEEPKNKEALIKVLISFFEKLEDVHAEFGYRTASEILRFAGIVAKIEPSWDVNQIIDAAVIQKLLPKLHGNRRKLEPVLKMLTQLCISEDNKVKYPLSHRKIQRMLQGLMDNSFTSFAEA
ncbi:MrcB family domain-containing protein [Chitinophaga sp. 22536]|uniref:MrcB family domain-containing protein n=1 Tax=unclassified Chitinophaga TaxID=2619133 RepID=UPI003F87168D